MQALFDTGAGASFLRRDIATQVGTIVNTPRVLNFTLGDGKGALQVREAVTIDVTINEVTVYFTVLVAEELGEER